MIQGIAQKSLVNFTAGGAVATATALASFPDRASYMIQNQATTPLFVKFGAGCSTTVYDVILKGGTLAADGNGGMLMSASSFVYTGIITVASATTASYSAVDF